MNKSRFQTAALIGLLGTVLIACPGLAQLPDGVQYIEQWPELSLGSVRVKPQPFAYAKSPTGGEQPLYPIGHVTIPRIPGTLGESNTSGWIRIFYCPRGVPSARVSQGEPAVKGGELHWRNDHYRAWDVELYSIAHQNRYLIEINLDSGLGSKTGPAMTKDAFVAWVKATADYARQVIDGHRSTLEIRFVRLDGTPHQTVGDFQSNLRYNRPFGVEVEVRERVPGYAGQGPPKPGVRVGLTVAGYREFHKTYVTSDTWHDFSVTRDSAEKRYSPYATFLHAPCDANNPRSPKPYVTNSQGRVFIDLRDGWGQPGDGSWVRKTLDYEEFGLQLLDSRRLNASPEWSKLGDLEFSLDACCYEEKEGRQTILAEHRQHFRVTHVASLLGTGIPPVSGLESDGVMIGRNPTIPSESGLPVPFMFFRPEDYAGGPLRTKYGDVLIKPRSVRIDPPLELMPGDLIRMGKHDMVKLRFLLDNENVRSVVKSNPEYFRGTELQHAYVVIHPMAEPAGKLGFGARLGISAGTSALFGVAAPTGPVGLVTVAILSAATSESLTGGIEGTMQQSVVFEVLRFDAHSTIGIDVADNEVRCYVLSGNTSVEGTRRGGKAQIREGEVLHIDKAGRFNVATYDILPESLTEAAREFQADASNAKAQVAAGAAPPASESWPHQWPVTATAPTWPGGKPGFYEDLVAVGDAVPPSGRKGFLVVHPPATDKPAKLSRRLTVPRDDPTLRLTVAANQRPQGDWKLRLVVNGTAVAADVPVEGKDGWRRLSFDLRRYAGREVTAEIEAWATGWYYEHAFFDSIEIGGENDRPASIEVPADRGLLEPVPDREPRPRVALIDLFDGELIAKPLFDERVMSFRHENGVGRLKGRARGVLPILYSTQRFGDFTAELFVRPVSGNCDYGLIFRSDDSEGGLDHYYILAISKDKTVQLHCWNKGAWQVSRKFPVDPTIFHISTSDAISLEVKGDTFTLYINSHLVGEVRDQTLTEPGRVGLFVLSDKPEPTDVIFESLLILEDDVPQARPAPEGPAVLPHAPALAPGAVAPAGSSR